MTRQFVSVKFNASAKKTYCFHNDGERVERGDMVKVQSRDGGWQAVEVVDVDFAEPTFDTKPIIGPAPKADAP